MSKDRGSKLTTDGVDKRSIRVKDIDRVFQTVRHFPSKILDVGSGNGAIINHYRERGYDVIGLEVSESSVSTASARFPQTKFLHYDGLHFPFEDSSYDTVLLNDVLEHISYEDIEQVLTEIKRVLKPNGVVYISVMNRWQLIEPHLLIPMLTWLPKFAWYSVAKKLRNREYIRYWPYTRGRLNSLLKRHQFSFTDLTRIYVQHKFLGVNPIGSRMTSRIFRLLKKLHLMTITYYFALKVSILVYVGHKI